jgi:fatty-acid desaturase
MGENSTKEQWCQCALLMRDEYHNLHNAFQEKIKTFQMRRWQL